MKCSNCGSDLPNNAHFCDKCGAKVNTSSQAYSGQSAYTQNQKNYTQASSGTEPHYAFCSECGAKNPDYLRVCNSCGHRLHTYNEDMYSTSAVARKSRAASAGSSSKKYVAIAAVFAAVILIVAVILIAYNMTNSNGDSDNIDITSATAQPDATPDATEAPSADPMSTDEPESGEDSLIGINSAQYDTYYIVNCSSTASLRESPDTASAILYDIPLGSPVSYVDSYQNGFARVIYNGTTGYVLQAYLSSNAADIQRSNTGSSNGGSTGGSSSSSGNSSSGGNSGGSSNVGAVSNPVYKTYSDSTYSFSCSYPSHFTVYIDNDSFVRYSLKAPDDTARLKICAKANSSGTTVKSALYDFKDTYVGILDYENSGDDWFACRTYLNGVYHYAYYKFTDGMIRGFELHFNGNYFDIYDGYVNDIYHSLKYN